MSPTARSRTICARRASSRKSIVRILARDAVRTASSSSRMPTSPSRYATSAICTSSSAGALLFLWSAACRSASTSDAPAISLRMLVFDRCALRLDTRALGCPSRRFASARVEQRNGHAHTEHAAAFHGPTRRPRASILRTLRRREPRASSRVGLERRALRQLLKRPQFCAGGSLVSSALLRAAEGCCGSSPPAIRVSDDRAAACPRAPLALRRPRPPPMSRAAACRAAPVRREADRIATLRPRARACGGCLSAVRLLRRVRLPASSRACSATSRATAAAASDRSARAARHGPPRPRPSPRRRRVTARRARRKAEGIARPEETP